MILSRIICLGGELAKGSPKLDRRGHRFGVGVLQVGPLRSEVGRAGHPLPREGRRPARHRGTN